MNIKIVCLAALLAITPITAMAHEENAKNGEEAAQAYMQPMKQMQDEMQAMTMTNDPNMDFVMMMKPHHQAAIDMAKAYLKYGNDPKLTAMAKNIVSSQKKEISEMDAWKTKRSQ